MVGTYAVIFKAAILEDVSEAIDRNQLRLAELVPRHALQESVSRLTHIKEGLLQRLVIDKLQDRLLFGEDSEGLLQQLIFDRVGFVSVKRANDKSKFLGKRNSQGILALKELRGSMEGGQLHLSIT